MTVSFTSMVSHPRLGVVTCEARDREGIAPAGHHLRWFVPASVGFPAAGFDVMHIDRDRWKQLRRDAADVADLTGTTGWTSDLNWAGRDRHHPVHPAAVVVTRADAALKPTSGGLRVAERGKGDHFLIHFNEPVIHVRLELRSAPRRTRSDPGLRTTPATSRLERVATNRVVTRRDVTDRRSADQIEVRHGAALLDLVDVDQVVEIERPGITDLLVPASIDGITSLTFVREVAAAELVERHGHHLAHLDLPRRATEAYRLTVVEKGIRNRLFEGSTLTELGKRYPSQQVTELVDHLNSTVGAPARTVHSPGTAELEPADIRVLDHLRLAAVDPTIARMLASYWVDLAPKPGLYVIRGDHDDPAKTLSFGFAFSHHAADVPALDKVTAEQLPGIEFSGTRPLGRAGLRVRRRRPPIGDATHTVMYDIDRRVDGRTARLTEKQLQLATPNSDLQYTDRRLRVPKTYSWAVTPIDVFGRAGKPVATDTLAMVDLERPVPPRNVVATVEQHGAPWLDPSLRSASDLTGSVAATAEFPEAHWTVAPDTTELVWCWRPGTDGAAERTPNAWTELHRDKIERPPDVPIEWRPARALTTYPLTVAEARERDHATDAAMLARLDPVTRDAAEAVGAQPDLVEVLLDVALLEPDLFTGCEIALHGDVVTVVGSTAGVAATDDPTPDRRLTARLFVPRSGATDKIEAGNVLLARHPLGAEWRPGIPVADGDGRELAPPLIEVPLGDEPRRTTAADGGELAVDLGFAPAPGGSPKPVSLGTAGSTRTTIVGRVVADHRWKHDPTHDDSPTSRSMLLRVRPADAGRLLAIERHALSIDAAGRHHRPVVMPRTTIGLEGAPGDIAVDLDAAERFATIWLSAFTVDAGDAESTQVATPAEVRVVRPPPAVAMSAPYPEAGGTSASRGQLSTADVHSDATALVAWAPPDVGTLVPFVRYEVGRALETTIVAADRDRWMRGGNLGEAVALGVVEGPSVSLTVRSDYAVHPNGTVSVIVEAPTPDQRRTLATITSGRVRITVDGNDVDHRFAKSAPVHGGPHDGRHQVLFRPTGDAIRSALGPDPTGRTLTLDGSPDYSAVVADDDLLRQLADLAGNGLEDNNERAFGLVTGVPTAALRLVDRLPGLGRSRFFYKVRAVFPGETRSAWSPASVAFHQVDATAAEPPENPLVSTDGRLVSFRLPDDPLVAGVGIRAHPGGDTDSERQARLDADGASTGLRPAGIRARHGLVDLAAALGSAAFTDAGQPPPVTGIYPADVDRDAPPDDANLLGDAPIARSVAIPREHDGRALAIRLTDGASHRWVDAIPGRHEADLVTGETDTPPGHVTLRTLKFVDLVRGDSIVTVPFHSDGVDIWHREVSDALDG